MANKKISELQSRTPALSDLMLVGDPSSGYSYKCTVTALATIIETDIADGYVTIGTTQTISGAKTFSNNLTLTSVANATTTQTKFLTLNGSNVVTYRTGAEVLSDIGGVGGSGTTNYLSKFSATTTLANSQIFDNGTNIGIGTATPDATARVQINKTDGYGLFLNYTTNTGTAPTAVALWALNTTLTGGYAAIIEERTPVNNGGQYPFSIKHSLSSGTAQVGMGTGVHFQLPDDAGTFKTTQLTIETIDAAAATYKTRYRFNVQNNGSSTPIAYINATGLGVFTASPSVALDVTGEGKFSTINNATTDTDKFLVSDGGLLKYRTGAEVLSDIGAASSSSISGTTNYIPKFTSSSAIGNSQIFDNGTSVGIGNTNPNSYYNGANNLVVGNTTASNGMTIASINSGFGAFYFADGTTGSELYRGFIEYGHTNDYMAFGSAGSERMRLTSGGLLGLGTSSPNARLQVSNSSSDGIIISTTANVEPFLAIWRNSASNGVGVLRLLDGGNIAFDNGATGAAQSTKMTLTASGSLGIGTSAPSGLFEVKGDGVSYFTRGTKSILLNPNVVGANTNALIETSTGMALAFGTNGSERMRLDASGRLGIGTSTPDGIIDVTSTVAGTAYSYFQNESTTGVTSVGLAFAQSGSIKSSIQSAVYGNDYMTFNVGSNTERMRIDASGNLGLGTSSPDASYMATISSNTDYKGLLITGSGHQLLQVQSTTSARQAILALKNGGQQYSLLLDTDNALKIYDNTSAATRLTLSTSGNLGLGVTPSAWASFTGLQVGETGSFASNDFGSGNIQTFIGNNVYYDAVGFKYIQAGSARMLRMTSDNFNWEIAGSGSANGAISFTQAMTLDASGRLGIGITNPATNLDVNGYARANSGFVGGSSGLSLWSDVSAGAPGIFLGTNQRVGIGTTSPNTQLQVNGTPSSSWGNLALFDTRTAAIDQGGVIAFAGYKTTTSAGAIFGQIAGEKENSTAGNEAGYLSFLTNNNTAVSERMRITSGGLVYIGSSTGDGYRLQINGNTQALSTFGQTYVGVAAYSQWVNSSGAFVMGLDAANGSTERMRITSGGNVGIGTSNPTNKLEVVGGRTYIQTGNEIYTLGISRSGANAYYLGISNSISPDLYFSNNAGTTRVTFTDGGNVGIGTTSPGYQLSLSKAGSTFMQVENTTTSNSVFFGNSGGSGWIETTGAYATIFQNNGSERMRITSGGNVGIGTTSPTSLSGYTTLSVNNATNGGILEIMYSNTPYGRFFTNQNVYVGLTSVQNVPLIFGTNDTERMRLTSTGLGIGTTSPNTPLQVNTAGSTSSERALRLLNPSGNFADCTAELVFQGGYTTTYQGAASIRGGRATAGDDGYLSFLTNPGGTSVTERMRITSGGNVGIGTSSPTAVSNYTTLTMNGTNASMIDMQAGTTLYGRIEASSSSFNMIAKGNVPFVFQTNPGTDTERMRITAAGELLINTTSDAGDYKLQVNGNGYFSGNILATGSGNTTISATSTASFPIFQLIKTGGVTWNIENGRTGNTFGIYQSGGTGGGNTQFSIAEGGNVEIPNGSIKTAAPSGGTAQPWKLGSKVTQGGILSLDVSNYIQVEINGTVWKLGVVN